MPQPLILYKVTPNTQKAVATAGGFALVALVVTPVGKRVFLLIVTTITTVMHGMTPAATTVKKAAIGRSKSPPLAVKKHSIESPLPCHHQGARVPACCVLGDSGVFPYPSLGQQRVNDCRLYKPPICDLWGNLFLYRRSRTFFTANGGLFVFAPFQPAIRQARRGVAENIREFALEILSDTHGRIGQSPEKVQIFLFLLLMTYSRNRAVPLAFNAYG